MNYDKAYELARAIRESEEYRDVAACKAQVDAQPEAQRMLDDFRKRQMDAQMRQLRGETVAEEELQQLQRLYETIQLHTDIRRLLEAERRLMLMMDDIQRILAEPLEELFRHEMKGAV